MRAYDIGLSAIRTHQKTLSVIGNNIANAATPGYNRQKVHLVNRHPTLSGEHLLGAGVKIGNIERIFDMATRDAILRNDSLRGLVSEELSLATEIESLFTVSDSSIHTHFSEFFNAFEAVANSPEEATVREELLASGQQLLYQFRSIQSSLNEHRNEVVSTVRASINEMNIALEDVADLNRQLQLARAQELETADLLDRRDARIADIADITEFSINQDDYGRDIIIVGGGVVTIGEIAMKLELRQGSDGWGIYPENGTHQVPILAGRVGGMLSSINTTVPETLERLETLAQTIVRAVDEQHSKGLTKDGSFDSFSSRRYADNTQVPLVHSGLNVPLSRGHVTVTVTDGATGHRTSHRIDYDPVNDSLQDFVARVNAVDGVSALLQDGTGGFSIFGDGANQIDFAGRIDDVPDLANYSGTAPISFGGKYDGTIDDEYTVAFSGPGTIGSTSGLTATVVNSDGDTIAHVEVGSGYEAGTPIDIGNGITLQLGQGTVTATDTVSVLATADSDSQGLLAALGINTFFQGQSIETFELRSDIASSPELFAMSTSGNSGESSNAAALAGLRDLRFEELGDNQFIEELADFTAESGVEVFNLRSQLEQLDSYAQRLSEQQASISGVSVEEEFLEMLEVERAFQAAARFISTFDQTMDDIFQIIR